MHAALFASGFSLIFSISDAARHPFPKAAWLFSLLPTGSQTLHAFCFPYPIRSWRYAPLYFTNFFSPGCWIRFSGTIQSIPYSFCAISRV